MTPTKGKKCQICNGVVDRMKSGSTIDYCNICKSCGRVVHKKCVNKIKDVRIAGNFWLCECGSRNQIYTCENWSSYDA